MPDEQSFDQTLADILAEMRRRREAGEFDAPKPPPSEWWKEQQEDEMLKITGGWP